MATTTAALFPLRTQAHAEHSPAKIFFTTPVPSATGDLLQNDDMNVIKASYLIFILNLF